MSDFNLNLCYDDVLFIIKNFSNKKLCCVLIGKNYQSATCIWIHINCIFNSTCKDMYLQLQQWQLDIKNNDVKKRYV